MGALRSLTLKTGYGEGKNVPRYDINERVVGKKNYRGLLGSHHFTRAAYDGKYVGVSEKRWTDRYLELADNDPIIDAFDV